MTDEQYWHGAIGEDAVWLVDLLRDRVDEQDRVSERKFRLLACACCRSLLRPIRDPIVIRALEVVEAYADGLTDTSAMATAHLAARGVLLGLRQRPDNTPLSPAECLFFRGAHTTCRETVRACLTMEIGERGSEHVLMGISVGESRYEVEVWKRRRFYTTLVRDVAGNPFRPVTFAPEWRTDTALAIARQMYEARDFSAMPILADALQDAGCDNDDVLNHCRGDEAHVRGCWVVDLVLGKE